MVLQKILQKAEKDIKAKIALGVLPNENGKYLPKQKGWRHFSGYLKSK